MKSPSSDILSAALNLSESERMQLIDRLIESIPGYASAQAISLEDPQLEAELDRRFQDDNDSISWTDLRDAN